MCLKSLWSTWAGVGRGTGSRFLQETGWKSSWKRVENASGLLSRNGMLVERRRPFPTGQAWIRVFTTAVIMDATSVSSLHYSNSYATSSATMPHHGNHCAVKHDDTVAAPAEKQMQPWCPVTWTCICKRLDTQHYSIVTFYSATRTNTQSNKLCQL